MGVPSNMTVVWKLGARPVEVGSLPLPLPLTSPPSADWLPLPLLSPPVGPGGMLTVSPRKERTRGMSLAEGEGSLTASVKVFPTVGDGSGEDVVDVVLGERGEES